MPISPKMSSSEHVICRNAACLIVALLLGASPDEASARGRSFPIEVTGTIISVDRSSTEFTIQVDAPARVLTIGLRRDCRFVKNGAPAKIDIIRKAARVKVSYFATIFTGNLAVAVEANPSPHVTNGVLERISLSERELAIRLDDRSHLLTIRWAVGARFFQYGKSVVSASLQLGMRIKVRYYSPAFAQKYAVRIEVDSQTVK